MPRRVPEETLIEVARTVQSAGGIAPAARVLELPRTTVSERYERAKQRGLVEPEGTVSRTAHDKQKRDAKQLRSDLVASERLIEQQKRHIEQLQKAKRPKLPSRTKRTPKGAFCRVIVPDSHGSSIDRVAARAFLDDLESIDPAEIVMLGDHLECGGFLAEHHTWHYVAETEYTFQDDCEAANWFLDEIQRRCPSATVHYLEGNHEVRLERWVTTQVVRNQKDGAFFRQMVSPQLVLNLQGRGIRYYPRSERHHGLSVQGAIRLGQCHFVHGITSAKHAAARTLEQFGGNVVFGHTHRAESRVDETISAGTIGAWCPGCLCAKQPMWRHGAPTGWTHGYGLQLVQKDGRFLHINVPIIEGASYLLSMTSRLN